MVKCQCGCGEEIILQHHHKYYGIPKYINGHASRGKNNPFYGKRLTKEHIAKIKQSEAGKHYSPKSEFKKGMIPWIKNKHHTMESKLKISIGHWKGGSKISNARHTASRKKLGFIPLNECREDGWVGHHIDKDYVIFIPEELHRSIYHSVIKNKNMDIINDAVYEWFINEYLKGEI